ncbi:MAG: GTP-binding protein [Ginsengibacter sp.]
MKLFLVGGFLGSGKTTAISNAAMYLQQNNLKVGVITNDQGLQQVDAEFIKSQDIPSNQISNGCFCCKYDDLEKSIKSLVETVNPDFIFAESVGSCTDLAATVINPLLTFNPDQYEIVFSCFADVRLLIKFLQKQKSIFYDNVNYIYGKQLEEADIIIINKIDLLTEVQLAAAKLLIEEAYGGKTILYQNSLLTESIQHWLSVCNDFQNPLCRPALDIDYEVYGAGEGELAWLDEEIWIVTKNKKAMPAGYILINKIYGQIIKQGYAISHLKFLINDGCEQKKISFTSIPANPVQCEDDHLKTDRVIILINARIQISPALLQQTIEQAIDETEMETKCKIIENSLSVFQPGFPRPTHRITG